VIHAAGDTGAGAVRAVASLERADCERQLRPKARGVEVLDELLGDEPLDFVLLTSSLSTVLGGLGLGAYAAANHYLDAFARRQHQRGRGWWMSVDWDGWRFTDPAALEMGMSPEEGSEIFARLVGFGGLPQVVVSTAPLAERLEQWTRADRTAVAPEPGAPVHARPDLHTVYIPPEDATERRLAEIWAQLLGIDRVGLDDNFFELGGSSLLAVHLMGKLRKEFEAELSVATLFEAPTVRALSRVIRAPGAAASELERSQDRGQMRRQNRRDQRRTSNAVE
jgi:acyl carrier protein